MMPEPPRLTEIAHRKVAVVADAGDILVDATAGNGFDTLFLANMAGPHGRVYAFDIQSIALARTQRRLESAGLSERVILIHQGHEALCEALPAVCRGRVAAVMFNLGYLPRGDKALVTRTGTTLAALEQAVVCLRPEGALAVIAYPGHPGGAGETDAVARWFRNHDGLSRRLEVLDPDTPGAPCLYFSQTPAGDRSDDDDGG